MNKLYITDYLSPPPTLESSELAGLATVECLMARSTDGLIGRVDDADAIIVFHDVAITRSVVDVMDHCKVIVRCGVGYDNVDLQAAGARGIFVCNVPDYGVDEVADHAIGFMLACNRGMVLAERKLRVNLAPWDCSVVSPVLRLCGATMGIIGLGRIGTATALRAKALKMRVLACDPYLTPGIDKAVGVTRVDLDTLLHDSDVVSLHVPLTEETRSMIDAAALAKMKSDAILINTARGAVVDVDALADALQHGRIRGAGIDVLPTEPPEASMPLIRLWQQDTEVPVNLLITPHTAFYSESGLTEMRTKAAREAGRVLQGQPPQSCVNPQHLSPSAPDGSGVA